MKSALIVSSTEKGTVFISEMLKKAAIEKVSIVSSGGKARQLYIDNSYDLCVINTPLLDEFGDLLASDIAEKSVGEVILLVNISMYDEISNKVEDLGVITVGKPVNRNFFWNALKLSQATHRKMQQVKTENKKLQQRIEDIRIIDRAKYALIQKYKISEEEAHRLMEKQAMDQRLTKRQIAETVLNQYKK